MSDDVANQFMRTILAEPDGDVPRLIFADWLEETGNDSNAAWAHFIRLQAELGRAADDAARRRDLGRAVREAAAGVRARLTLRAGFFRRHFISIFRLIPPANLRLKLPEFEWPQITDIPPSFIARYTVVPVYADAWRVIVAGEHYLPDPVLKRCRTWLRRELLVVLALPGQARRAVETWLGEFTT
jgi:uncharacterized protein (TIGR02996 family)